MPRGIRTVGPRQTRQVRLSPALRRLLQRRADAAARRRYRPEIRALRGQKRGIRRAYRQEVRSVEGAVDMAQDALSNVSLKGLKGPYRQQVARELTARSADVAQSIPLLTAEARSQKQEALAGVRTDIIDAKVARAQTAADKYESLVGSARTEGKSVYDKGEGGKRVSDFRKGVKQAVAEAIRLLKAYPNQMPRGDKQWNRFVDELAKADGVTSVQQALTAMAIVRKRLQGSKQGLPPEVRERWDPDVYGPGY